MKDFRVVPDTQDLFTSKTGIMLQIRTVLLIQIIFETVFSAKILLENTLRLLLSFLSICYWS